MAVKIVDGSSVHKNFDGILKSFLPHAKKTLGYDKPVDIQLVSDPENAKDPFGKTAYYDPNQMKVTVFVDKRHVKDILRSISHELVHHKQNCQGRLHALQVKGTHKKILICVNWKVKPIQKEMDFFLEISKIKSKETNK